MVVAVIVAFTISFELTALVTKSVLDPVGDLLKATERVTRGDLSTRVPVVSGDEMGSLAASFNEMVRGLEEREALMEAFGSYVDPDVADRVLREGELLEGEQVEATMLFVDICDFTAFAENASAREAVAHLNDFFGLRRADRARRARPREQVHRRRRCWPSSARPSGTPTMPTAPRSAAVRIADAVEQHYGGNLRIADRDQLRAR